MERAPTTHELTVRRVRDRAAVHHVQAAQVVWSDALCPERQHGKAAIGAYSMDLRAMAKGATDDALALYFAPQQHMHDLELAASRAVEDVPLPGGTSLRHLMLDTLQVRSVPRTAECRVQALVVYDEEATVEFNTYAYRNIATHTFVVYEDGTHTARTGDGRVGRFHLRAPDTDDGQAAGDPATVRVVTLFTQGDPHDVRKAAAPVYRSLVGAVVTPLQADDHAPPTLEGKDILAARVEIVECHVVTRQHATDQEVDRMCQRVLQRQATLGMADGPRAAQAIQALHSLST